jgi:hypothetical protein
MSMAQRGGKPQLPFLKNKKRRHHDKEKPHRMVPLDVLSQVPDGEK